MLTAITEASTVSASWARSPVLSRRRKAKRPADGDEQADHQHPAQVARAFMHDVHHEGVRPQGKPMAEPARRASTRSPPVASHAMTAASANQGQHPQAKNSERRVMDAKAGLENSREPTFAE
jgi:hypothetical protein